MKRLSKVFGIKGNKSPTAALAAQEGRPYSESASIPVPSGWDIKRTLDGLNYYYNLH